MNPVSYAKKKNQEKMEKYDRYVANAKALAFGQWSSVPRPPSSPPPGGSYPGVGQRKRWGGMIQVMPSKKGKGNASAEEIKSEPARSSLPSSSKARPPMKIYIKKPSSKGAPAPWRRKKNAAKVIFV